MFFKKSSLSIEDFCEKIKGAFGSQLLSAYSYPEFLGDPHEKTLLLIIKEPVYDKILSLNLGASSAHHVKVFTLEELHHSLDVFPLEFLELQQCRSLLHGDDVLAQLDIDDHHIRLQCEFYLRSLILKVREASFCSVPHAEKIAKQSMGMLAAVQKYLQCPLSIPDGLFVTHSPYESLLLYFAFLDSITAYCDKA